ncbi:hypothetical protein SK3146_06568 [Paenibacillus konkukensis]|uniref:Uncharacterized protein n=1 Tax=Paenibacillus konkukensis TaxID=2020716 RepID=A0ABY4RX93_9BACL|nr:hypothetical protein [Paenibacillus konkukensis]UQZ87271.1 hypothetical protein SK3146_06568 [Paenibacillus konkukensis]
MNWLEIIKSPTYLSNSSSSYDSIRLINYEGDNANVTPLAQFFLAPVALSEPDLVTPIPTPSSLSYNRFLEEIAVHFNKIKVVYSGEIPHTLMLSNLKDSSRLNIIGLHRRNELNPVVSELYGNLGLRPRGFMNKTIYMKLKKEYIPPVNVEQFDAAWNWLESSYAQNDGYICLTPTNWMLSERLKENISLRYFVSRCKDIILVVDEPTNSIIGLDLLF